MAELEKEVCRLRATERSLRDGISSKLLLEEQVNLLTSRVEAAKPVQQELHEAKVTIWYNSVDSVDLFYTNLTEMIVILVVTIDK